MSSDRQSIIASIVLHGIALGALALLIYLNPLQAEEEPVVLELVDLPPDMPDQAEPTPEQAQPAVERVQINPALPREMPDIAIPEPPAPTPPEPEPQRTPEPEPRPVVTPQPPKPPKPQMTNMTDFRKEHGVRRVDSPAPAPRRAPTPAPRINAPTVSLENTTPSPPPSASNANADLIAKYYSRLKNAIELSWDKPSAGSGSEWAEVSFRVFSNGSIGNIKIEDRNAPDAFVESVRQAIATTLPIGPPPSGMPKRVTITFRLQ